MNLSILIEKRTTRFFVIICLFFILLHLPGLNNLYHQDEYKWVLYSHPEIVPPGTVPHPPLTELIYTRIGPPVGDYNFRFIPFLFGFINLFLLFYLSKFVLGSIKSALISVFLFAISFYSLLASLTVDVDGAVMPFFMLILSIGYFKFRSFNFDWKKNWGWLILALFGGIGGFFIKVSGLLPIIAFATDFAIEKKFFQDKKKIIKYFISILFSILILLVLLYFSKFIFPFFKFEYSLNYWKHFANSSSFWDRGWLQTFIQFIKSVIYVSPLLLLPVFLSGKEIFKKLRPLFIFIFAGIVFYLFLFDFSIGALDRYFQFLVLPLCVISGAVISKVFSEQKDFVTKKDLIIITIITFTIFFLQFLDHFVPPLYPKTEWITRVLNLRWNFLFPFTGGSGPTGFYISFLFIALIWICSIVFLVNSFISKETKKRSLFAILVLGILYNGVFIEEYLFGKINGSSYKLFTPAEKFIEENDEIKKVLVYNDIGGFNIMKTGKYDRRLYAAPQFEDTYKDIFGDFNGHVLYVDIPKIGENNFYSNYLNSCEEIYKERDRYITAKILNCGK